MIQLNNKDKLICYCIQVTEQTIIESIQRGNNSLSAIKQDTSACTGTQCKELNPSGKCCSRDIKNLIQEYSTNINLGNPQKCNCG